MYPMLDLHAPHWTTAYFKQLFDAPQFPASVVDKFLEPIRSGAEKRVVTNAHITEGGRFQFGMAALQHGRTLDVLGEDDVPRRLHPEDRVADGKKLPPTFFVHGTDDTVVPVAGTDKFISLLRDQNVVEGGKIAFARVPGGHGFDTEINLGSASWMEEGTALVEQAWMA